MSANERVWKRLADARPAGLEPAPDPARRERDLTRAMAATARNDLAAAERPAAAAPQTAGPGAARPARSGPGRRVSLAVALGAVAAVAAVAAAVVVQPWSGPDRTVPVTQPPERSSAPDRPDTPASARQVLLAAAADAERQGATTGRIWQTRTESATVEPVIGADYLIEVRWRDESRFDSSDGRGTWTRTDLAARPARPSDVAAWRKAGSPRSWQISVPGPCPRDAAPTPGGCTTSRTVSAEPGKPVSLPLESVGGAMYSLAGRNVTADDLARLPADPVRLKAKLLEGFNGCGTEACSGEPVAEEAWLFENAGGLVTQMPVTPQVRAAAFRMLADLPGMAVVPAVRDALGRDAVAVELRSAGRRLLIDPETWDGLAVEEYVFVADSQRPWAEPGLRIGYLAVESVGWTGN